MQKTTLENRKFPRVALTFPIQITPDFIGETVNLSESGLRFVLEDPLLSSRAHARIELSAEESIETEFKVVWHKHLVQQGKFTYAVCFINIKEKDRAILQKVLSKSKQIDERFTISTDRFKGYLELLKARFDKFDTENTSDKERIGFIKEQRKDVFKKLDFYFTRTWKQVDHLDKNTYKIYQQYFQNNLRDLLLDPIEINRYIYQKPFGHPGDYVMLNYIYDYNGDNRYLGNSSYEKLLNNYTCNIQISDSNVLRKEILKEKIINIMEFTPEIRIFSVGCGSAREVIELLEEEKVKKYASFDLFDHNKKALDYIKESIEKIELKKRANVAIKYFDGNYIDFIRHKDISEKFKDYDFIYCPGIFDYLSERIATKLIDSLYRLLNKNGTLLICNASKEFSNHRAYYEMIGEWTFIHRDKEEMLPWLKNIKDAKEIKFDDLSKNNNYLYLSVTKQ